MVNIIHFFLAILFVFACGGNVLSNPLILFKIIPDTVPPASQLYLTGNQSELGEWRADAFVLSEESDRSWQGRLELAVGTTVEFKITRGSWQTEAVDDSGVEFPNFKFVVRSDTTIVVRVPGWRDLYAGSTVISPERFMNKAGRIELFNNWRYHPGDDLAWADPVFDDRHWEEVNPLLPENDLPQSGWEGNGWFRVHLQVDSALLGKPVGFYFVQAGASELYLDGILQYQLGVVSTDSTIERTQLDYDPKYLIFSDKPVHIIAVRYSNQANDYFFDGKNSLGFLMTLEENLNQFISGRISQVRLLTVYQMIFTLIPITLAFIHLLIFIFYRSQKANLTYAISMLAFAVLAFVDFNYLFVPSVRTAIIISQIGFVAINIALIFGLLTIYTSLKKQHIPLLFYIILFISLVLILWAFIHPQSTISTIFYVLLAIAAVEILRQGIRPFAEQDFVMGTGLIILAVAVILQVLIDLDIIAPIGGNPSFYMYGVLALGLAVSINLARNFASMNRTLLQQERERQEQELARKLLEMDNKRKTEELEEARRLQLSMLPPKIPEYPHLDIAVKMVTATEVGGDYYDFYSDNGQQLTTALGDATGHGTKAGMLVALIKSQFNSSGNTFYLPDFFTQCSNMIKKMNLGNLYMALLLLRIQDYQMNLAMAGMPPLLIYRAEQNKIEEIILKGLPLGGPAARSYPQKNIRLKPGDVILLMSDGLMEQFNPQGEQFDLENIKITFQEAAKKSPKEIIDYLIRKGTDWRKSEKQRDDMTFMVIGVK